MTEKLSGSVNIVFNFKYLSRAKPTQPVSRRKNMPFEKNYHLNNVLSKNV
jgi:hypothetical protein